MAKKNASSWDPATVPVEEFNRRLKRLRKRAKKASGGGGGARARAAQRRWSQLQALGSKKSCCGNTFEERCASCPRSAGELVLAPFS